MKKSIVAKFATVQKGGEAKLKLNLTHPVNEKQCVFFAHCKFNMFHFGTCYY